MLNVFDFPILLILPGRASHLVCGAWDQVYFSPGIIPYVLHFLCGCMYAQYHDFAVLFKVSK